MVVWSGVDRGWYVPKEGVKKNIGIAEGCPEVGGGILLSGKSMIQKLLPNAGPFHFEPGLLSWRVTSRWSCYRLFSHSHIGEDSRQQKWRWW